MKVFAGLAVAAIAGPVGLDRGNTKWPANPDAPHCGCQFNLDPKELGQQWNYMNATCSLTFNYPINAGNGNTDPHFVSVASSYMVGREYSAVGGPSEFKFTGYNEVSNPDLLDILVFFEKDDCARTGFDLNDLTVDGMVPQHEIWEYYNMTSDQMSGMCDFDLVCTPTADGQGLPGVHLGNFDYDIARSVQTYTVPIYGLEKTKSAEFNVLDYTVGPVNCMNVKAHDGHGTATGCSQGDANSTEPAVCSNKLTFTHDQDHNGLLEYFQFEPVSPVNNPMCFALPLHHIDDYKWSVPSPWDMQNDYEMRQ